MNNSITWLHLSDLHARLSHDWDAILITRALVDDLKKLHQQHELRPDFIFFTGDAAFGASGGETMEAQYGKVKKFFDAVRQVYSPELPKRNIYVVPGNHDVNRNEVSPSDTMWLRASGRTVSEVIDVMAKNGRQWRNCIERLQAYREFLKSYELTHLLPDDPQLIWSDVREVAGVKVGIAGFNSAWSCSGDEEKGRLWWGGDWQIPTLQERMGPVDLPIALIHHPGNWLTDHEDPSAFIRLRQNFTFVMHGHEHHEWVVQDSDGNTVLSAGACYQSSKLSNGYSIGQLDVNTGGGRIFLRAWDPSGGGWVARNIARRAENGIWPLAPSPWLPTAFPAVSQAAIERPAAKYEAAVEAPPVNYASCFISYSHQDEAFAQRLYFCLRKEGLRVWYASEDMQAGRKIHEQIESAIQTHDKLLLVLSEGSLSSEWVKTEIRNAREHERNTGKRKLFPIRLVNFDTIRDWRCFDADGGKDLGVELREFYIPDFSIWTDPDKFESEFTKLLRALKADTSPVAQSPAASDNALSEQALSILKIFQQTNTARAVMFRNGQHFGLLPHGGQFGFSEEPLFISEDLQTLVDLGLLTLADYNGAGDPIYAVTRAGVSLVKDRPEIRDQDGKLIGAPR